MQFFTQIHTSFIKLVSTQQQYRIRYLLAAGIAAKPKVESSGAPVDGVVVVPLQFERV